MEEIKIDESVESVRNLYDTGDVEKMKLGSIIAMKLHQKIILSVYPKFSDFIYDNECVNGKGYFPERVITYVRDHEEELNSLIDHSYDYKYDLSALESFKSTYFLRKNGVSIETPQYLLLREALGIWIPTEDEEDTFETIREHYLLERECMFTNATPIKANALCKNNPLISCFIQKLTDDSINGIGTTMLQTMQLQKANGGVSTAFHELRAAGSNIETSGRSSDGICKPLKIFNEIALYVDQNKKRPGAHVIYLACYHPDIFDFIHMKNQFSPPAKQAVDLFYGFWADELFFKRVEENGDWYLMCPSSYPNLNLVSGEAFDELYLSYVKSAEEQGLLIDYDTFTNNRFKNQGLLNGKVLKLPARKLMNEVFKAQAISGVPYVLNKTEINRCSNFEFPIEASNLCCEITLPFSQKFTNVCCLASIKVSEFLLSDDQFEFNWDLLRKVVRLLVKTLDRVLTINKYPNELSRKGAMEYRAIGIGQQDLSSIYLKLGIPYDSELARSINVRIQEFIYYHALDTSCDLAKIHGPYPRYNKSKFAQGILHPDNYDDSQFTLDWETLREKVKTYGVRNSQLIANMPTGNTSLLCGSTIESVEPLYSNIYTRRLLHGTYIIVNNYLVRDLEREGIYNPEIVKKIVLNDGNIGKIEEIPEWIRKVHATVYEIGMGPVIDHYADRQRFVCQSQSMNFYPREQKSSYMFSAYMYAVKRKLKTISYYYRGGSNISAAKNFEVKKVENCESCTA